MDIGSIKNRIGELEKQRNDCSKEIDDSKEKRDLLNLKIREFAERIKELREKRDVANALVRQYKDERARLQTGLVERRAVLKEKRDYVRKMMRDVPTNLSPGEIKESIQKLEFEFQTTPMSSMADERKFLERIKSLERTYELRMKADGAHQEAAAASAELDKLRESVEAVHLKVVENSNLSQQHHEGLIELSRQMDPMRRDADEAHRAMVAALERKKAVNQQLADVRKQFLEVKAERQAQDLAEREAALRAKADDIKGTLKGRKRFDLRQLQVIAQSGQEFSFGGEDGNAVSISLREEEAPRKRQHRKAAEREPAPEAPAEPQTVEAACGEAPAAVEAAGPAAPEAEAKPAARDDGAGERTDARAEDAAGTAAPAAGEGPGRKNDAE